VRGTWRILLLLAGTVIGAGMAAAGDLRLARRVERAAAGTAAVAPHDAEERQLVEDISRFLEARRELERRVGILERLRDPLAFRSPAAAMRRTLDWARERKLDVNGLLFEEGELEAIVPTAEPAIAIVLARDLVARRLIEVPEVKWTAPGRPDGLRWLGVSGRLAPPGKEGTPVLRCSTEQRR